MKQSTIIYLLVWLILLVSSRQQWQRYHQSWQSWKVYAPTDITAHAWNITPKMSQACYKDFCFDLEIADTPSKRQQGLMYRNELWKNSWMLFVFDQVGKYPFWMKNTLIPLDMLWLDGSGVVVEIAQAVPCLLTGSETNRCLLYGGGGIAKYVLELNAWKAVATGIGTWVRLDIK